MSKNKSATLNNIHGNRQTNQVLESLLEATDFITWAVDQQYRLIYHCKNFGAEARNFQVYTAPGGINQPGEKLGPETKEEWIKYYRSAFEGKSFSVQKEVGSAPLRRLVEFRFGPLKNKSSEDSGAFVVASDMTDRYVSEVVEETQRKLYTDYLLHKDPRKTCRECLETALKITGMHCGGLYIPDATGQLALECSRGAYEEFFIASMNNFGATVQNRYINSSEAVYASFHEIVNSTAIVRNPGKPMEASAILPVKISDDVSARLLLVSHTDDKISLIKRKIIEGVTGSMGILINQGNFLRELQQSENKFRAIFEQAPVGIDLVSADGTPFRVNRTMEKILERSEQEMIAGKVTDWTHPDDRERSLEKMREIVSGKTEHFNLKKRYIRSDGSIVWANTYVAAVRNDRGKLNFFIAMVEDITEEVRAREKINFQSELLTNINDAVIASDRNFVVTYWNNGAEKMYGYSVKEALGRPANDLLKTEFPGRDYAKQIRALRDEGKFRGEVINFTKAGKKLFIDARANALYDQEGNLTGYLSINRNITERKEMEQRLFNSQQLFVKTFSAINDAIFVIDPGKRQVILCNRSVEKVFGYTADEVTNRSTKMLHLDNEHFESFNRESLPELDRNGIYRGIFKMKRKDGTIIDTEHVVTEITDEFGNRQGVVSYVRDITHRLRNEMEVIRKSDQLRSLARHLQDVREEEKKHLSREIHDDLGQMLSALKMNISGINRMVDELEDSIQKEKLRPELVEAGEILSEAIRKMRQMITELRPEILDYLGLFPALEWQLEEFSKRYNIKTTFICDPEQPSFDPDEQVTVFRLLQESLNNIAKHAGASNVRVKAKMDPANFTLQVEDDGKGFDVEMKANDTSFGLIGMKERILALAGNIQIDSNPGDGTRLIFKIPLKKNAE